MDEREKARLELQERVYAAKTQAERNRLGQFATPQKLASEIVGHAVSLLEAGASIRFLEPGFGTGPFYSALLRHVPASRIRAAVGYEIDPHYAEPAKQLWEDTGLRLETGDFTKAEPPKTEAARYNLVVCNPPYIRHHHLSQTQKRWLQAAVAQHLRVEMNGLSGMYAYFMLLSQAWMSKDGVAAWLIPSEFMDVNYGRRVKQFLTETVTLQRIHRFDPNEVQFKDALVSSAVVVFKNSPPPGGHEVRFTFGGTVDKPKASDSVALKDLCHVPKWTALPQGNSRLHRQHNGATLADLFTIKRGLVTGHNSFFVLSPEQARGLGLPREFLRPILPSPREIETDEILADRDGEPQIAQRRYLLSCTLPEAVVRSTYAALWEYLQRGIEERVHERYLCRHRKPWYCQETRPPAPFLCTYMGRATLRSESPFRFILNHSNATAANVYLLLYPKPILAARLTADPALHRAVWKALSSITAEALMGEGRVYGGGLHKLEPRELGNVRADAVMDAVLTGRESGLCRQLELFAR